MNTGRGCTLTHAIPGHACTFTQRACFSVQGRAAAVRQGKAVQQVKYSKARKGQAVQRGQGQAVSAVASSTMYSKPVVRYTKLGATALEAGTLQKALLILCKAQRQWSWFNRTDHPIISAASRQL